MKKILILLIMLMFPYFVYAGGEEDDVVSSDNKNEEAKAKPLICIYEGGTQNSPTMLVQHADGSFSVKINYYGDYTDKEDSEWYDSTKDNKWTLKFEDTNKFDGTKLTDCPKYVQHPGFSLYELVFHDSKGAFRLDYELYKKYEEEVDENNYGQSFEGENKEEIEKNEWLKVCTYSDGDGGSDIKMYFNREKMIFSETSSLISKVSTDFSLYDVLEHYDKMGGTCPTLYAKNDCYANIGNTFCYVNFSMEKSFWNSDVDKPVGDKPIILNPDIITQTCDSLLGSVTTKGSPAFYLAAIFSVLRYVAIAIIIVMTSLDFVGAVSSHDNEIIKKAVNKLLKRAILCVIIFLLPTVIEFILQFVHNRSITTCGIGG